MTDLDMLLLASPISGLSGLRQSALKITYIAAVCFLLPLMAFPPASLAQSGAQSGAQSDGALPPKWWNERVFYEIFIRSFRDSDGDGIGDIQGIIDRLDYLNDGDPTTTQDLGITGIWLMPPAEAHSYHGYDVTDYYAIERDYGTIEDMQRLIAAAHERGIAVIVDMVLNHTSSRHPWFTASRLGEPAYSDWYIWEDKDPGYVGPWGAVAWHPADDRYYYGVFWDGMPDLNFRNPAVSREFYNIAHYWLREIGVDGFRLDAIKHLIEAGERQENTPESRQWLSGYQAHLQSLQPNSFTVGEIFNAPAFIVARYVDEGAIDIGFDFKLAQEMISAAQSGSIRNIVRAHRNAMRDYPLNQFATFLSNHDQDRLINRLLHDIGRNKVAASLLLTGPGVPFLYYGEEIGMAGSKPDERIRSPMQWENSESGGFSAGATLWQPLQDADNLAQANVAEQSDDPNSLLSHYRRLIQLRNANSALRGGDLTAVDSSQRGVYAFLRHDDEQVLMVLINLDDEPATDFSLSLEELDWSTDLSWADASLVYGMGDISAPRIEAGGGFTGYQPLRQLAPQSMVIIEFKYAS